MLAGTTAWTDDVLWLGFAACAALLILAGLVAVRRLVRTSIAIANALVVVILLVGLVLVGLLVAFGIVLIFFLSGLTPSASD